MKKISIPPSPSRLIENLTQIGYSLPGAVADLIDNSIQAKASEIDIQVYHSGIFEEPCVVICDNGIGMNKQDLINGMKFGSNKDYDRKDLGKFGLGLKTASLSQCRILTVISKPRCSPDTKSRLNICKWDMTHVFENDKWDILNPSLEELENYEKEVFYHYESFLKSGGTLIIWSDMKEFIPDLYNENKEKRSLCLSEIINDLQSHLGIVFHRFIEGSVSGKKSIKIDISDREIESIDPFCKQERSTHQLDQKNIFMKYKDGDEIKKSKVTLSPYILPKEHQFSSPEAYKKASSLGTWLSRQGFYFYRNGRLLKSGDWSSCATKDKRNIYLRIAVDFDEKQDLPFQVNISKEKASIPQEYKQEIKSLLRFWIEQARKKWLGKSKNHDLKETRSLKSYKDLNLNNLLEFKISEHGSSVLCKRNAKNNKLTINIPYDHDFSHLLEKKKGNNKLKNLSYIFIILLDLVKNNRLKSSHIPLDDLYEKFREIA